MASIIVLLWRRIEHCAQRARSGTSGRVLPLNEIEVGQRRRPVFTKEDVLRLDVAVHEIARVGHLEGFGDYLDNGESSIDIERLVRDRLMETTTSRVLHHAIVKPCSSPLRNEYPRDVWVVECGHLSSAAKHSLTPTGVLCKLSM